MRITLALACCCLTTWALGTALSDEPPQQAWFPQAPALPPATGEVVPVRTVDELFAAVETVQAGATILIADGTYPLPQTLDIHTDRVTLRSASGHRQRVILDGSRSQHGELVSVTGCTGVTIADLTIQNIKWNGFKINSDRGATRVTIRNCIIHNIWQRGVKGPAMSEPDRDKKWPTDCRIEYCLFYNDRAKQWADDPTDTKDTFNGNYVGGIDAMFARGWVICDNVFTGIHGRTGEGRGAIFLWNQSRDCIVERNVIYDCDVGICLGNHYRHEGTQFHADACVVRNNFVTRCAETGILAAHTRNGRIVHNTVHDPASALRRLIWIQDDNAGLFVANNLLSGPEILNTGTGKVRTVDNLAQADLAASFADASTGNLRVKQAISSSCTHLKDVATDIDGRERPERPTPGASEFAADPVKPQTNPQTTEADPLPYWVLSMRQVHAQFNGTRGYVAQLGDSITYSMAFWSPLGWDDPSQYLTREDGLPKMPPEARWRDVILGTQDKGPEFGNYSGWRVGQVLESIDGVLAKQEPELALIMIGTNDISGDQVPADYADRLQRVVRKCLEAHCIPILSTIPPRRDHDRSVTQVNDQIRDVAKRLQIPLIDYHAEIMQRRPAPTWDGTLISEDGVHPTAGETHLYTEENMRANGYALRNWLSFLMVREVYFRVLKL